MLWRDVQEGWQRLRQRGEPPFPALEQAIDAVFDARIGDISGRGKLATDMREIWMMQPRLERRAGNGPLALIEQPRFRAGFDFLRLRADAGEIDAELAEWWEDFSLGTDEERQALLDLARERDHHRRRAAAPAAARRRQAEEAVGTRPRPTAPRRPRASAAGAASRARPATRQRRRSGSGRAGSARRRRLSRRAVAAPRVRAAWIGLGANLGDARGTVLAALDEIGAIDGVRVVARSSLWRSAPVDAAGDDYVNAVALVETTLDAPSLLGALHAVEGRHGRERPYRNAPRTLDCDLLLHDDGPAASAALTLPHPRLHERAFVLLPMAEVCRWLGLAVEVPGRGRLETLLPAVRGQRIERLVP